jgi:hypothetical protein
MSQRTDAPVVSTIGIDTGKNTLHLVGLDDQRAIVLREKVARGRIRTRLANVPQCLIGIEAGMGRRASCSRSVTAAAKRLHHNVLATALANKLARIAWTILAERRSYETRIIADAA